MFARQWRATRRMPMDQEEEEESKEDLKESFDTDERQIIRRRRRSSAASNGSTGTNTTRVTICDEPVVTSYYLPDEDDMLSFGDDESEDEYRTRTRKSTVVKSFISDSEFNRKQSHGSGPSHALEGSETPTMARGEFLDSMENIEMHMAMDGAGYGEDYRYSGGDGRSGGVPFLVTASRAISDTIDYFDRRRRRSTFDCDAISSPVDSEEAEEFASRSHPHVLLQLRSWVLAGHVLVTCGLLSGMSFILWRYGREWLRLPNDFYPATDSDEFALYNNLTGVAMGLLQALLGMYGKLYLPVFRNYMHNLMWLVFPSKKQQEMWVEPEPQLSILSTPSSPALQQEQRRKRYRQAPLIRRVLFGAFVPLLVVGMGSILSFIQPGLDFAKARFAVGSDALAQNTTLKPLVQATTESSSTRPAVEDTVLRSLVLDRTRSFQPVNNSKCSRVPQLERAPRGFGNPQLFDGVSVKYGFAPHEWSGQMVRQRIEPTHNAEFVYADFVRNPASFNMPSFMGLTTAYELVTQGKAVLETSLAKTSTEEYPCSAQTNGVDHFGTVTNDSLQCRGPYTSLHFLDAQSRNKTFSELLNSIGDGLPVSMDFVSTKETVIGFESYELNDQVTMEVININFTTKPGHMFTEQTKNQSNGTAMVYQTELSKVLCGSTNCLFLDTQSRFHLKNQIVMSKYQTECNTAQLEYNPLVKNYLPRDCQTLGNASFVYGLGSHIVGEEIGNSFGGNTSGLYVTNAKRVYQLSFGKLTWESRKLTDDFPDTSCSGSADDNECHGVSHPLANGQHVFIGDQALPSFENTSFVNTVPLVDIQRTIPALKSRLPKGFAIDRLAPGDDAEYFGRSKWSNDLQHGDKCSGLVDSYLAKLEENHFFMENPLQAMYTSSLLFLFDRASSSRMSFENGSTPASAALAASPLPPKKLSRTLANQRLASELEVHRVFLANTFAGCIAFCIAGGLVLLLLLCVVCCPNHRVRKSRQMGPNERAELFVMVRTPSLYPSFLYHKLLVRGSYEEDLRFDQVAVESVQLAHIPRLRKGIRLE